MVSELLKKNFLNKREIIYIYLIGEFYGKKKLAECRTNKKDEEKL